MSVSLLNADARQIPLAPESVQCVVTSPPYYGLRDYGVNGQIGLERTPQEYVDGLVGVFREVWRVLSDTGVLWLNLGDSYASQSKGGGGPDTSSTLVGTKAENNGQRFSPRRFSHDVKDKDLLGIPWRVAFALQADGWYLRSDIIWAKPNPMPESVTDRPTKAHEYIFLLSKSATYFYDADAIAEPAQEWTGQAATFKRENGKATELAIPGQTHASHRSNRKGGGNFSKKYVEAQPNHGGESNRRPYLTRNKRTVWEVATSPYSGAHFATFPPKLVEPMVLAGSAVGDLVLDPFAGTATVGRVAIQHRRRFVGLELNPAYIALAQDRTSNVEVRML